MIGARTSILPQNIYHHSVVVSHRLTDTAMKISIFTVTLKTKRVFYKDVETQEARGRVRKNDRVTRNIIFMYANIMKFISFDKLIYHYENKRALEKTCTYRHHLCDYNLSSR